MLYIVELEHNPESCITADPQSERAQLLGKLEEFAEGEHTNILDGWSFPVGHRMWFLVDAQNEHHVSEIFFKARIHLWSTIVISPVMDFESFKTNILGSNVSQKTA